jgi:hypothetical protein
MTRQQNIEFLWNNLVFIIQPVYNWIVNLCKKTDPVKNEDFIPSCVVGNLEKVKKITDLFVVDLNDGLTKSVHAGQTAVAEFLIKKGANNLDENLKFACSNNNFTIAEMLVKNGAKVIVGLRVAKSINIIKMLHRYEQGSELINW